MGGIRELDVGGRLGGGCGECGADSVCDCGDERGSEREGREGGEGGEGGVRGLVRCWVFGL